jgi:hypothetical protein
MVDGACVECALIERQLAAVWCCKNVQQTHQALLEDVVERLAVISREDGERNGKRGRKDSDSE